MHPETTPASGTTSRRLATLRVGGGAPGGLLGLRAAVEIEQVAGAFYSEATASAVAHGLRGQRTMDALVKRASHPQTSERVKVASMSTCPPEMLTILAGDHDPSVREAVAANPSTPDDLLMGMCDDERPQVRVGLAKNRRVGEWTTRCASDPERRVRVRLAKNERLPLRLAVQVSTDADVRVRAAHARWGRHLSALEPMVADTVAVRTNLAQNPSIDAAVVGRLADDHAPGVRLRVIYRCDCPRSTLDRLCDDDDLTVASFAQIARDALASA